MSELSLPDANQQKLEGQERELATGRTFGSGLFIGEIVEKLEERLSNLVAAAKKTNDGLKNVIAAMRLMVEEMARLKERVEALENEKDQVR